MKTPIQDECFPRVDVTHISTYGIWLLTHNNEIFVSFNDFPQLRTAISSKLKHVAQLHPDTLYWPDLDTEIPIKHVRYFPLVSPKPRSAVRSRRQTKMRSVAVS